MGQKFRCSLALVKVSGEAGAAVSPDGWAGRDPLPHSPSRQAGAGGRLAASAAAHAGLCTLRPKGPHHVAAAPPEPAAQEGKADLTLEVALFVSGVPVACHRVSPKQTAQVCSEGTPRCDCSPAILGAGCHKCVPCWTVPPPWLTCLPPAARHRMLSSQAVPHCTFCSSLLCLYTWPAAVLCARIPAFLGHLCAAGLRAWVLRS